MIVSTSNFVKDIRVDRQINVVDLFSGCGGMSWGFKEAHYRVLAGIESNDHAATAYARNIFRECDEHTISKVGQSRDINTLSAKDFRDELPASDQVDVIIGGPPCQAFARIGRAKLMSLKRHPLTDERARLYTRYLNYVKHFRPLAVVMENVPDIMNVGGQNVAELIASDLYDLGYQCHYTVLNSAHYGVPQARHRFFLIAFHQDLNVEPSFPSPTHEYRLPDGYHRMHKVATSLIQGEQKYYLLPPAPIGGLPGAVTVEQALHDLPFLDPRQQGRAISRPEYNNVRHYQDVEPSQYAREMRGEAGSRNDHPVYNHVTRYLPRDFRIFEQMQPGDQYPRAHQLAIQLFEKELKARKYAGEELVEGSQEYRQLWAAYVPPYKPDKFPNKWWKLKPGEPSRTLTAHMGKDTYSHIHYDPQQPRTITVREAARLQSFPDDFWFPDSINAAFQQIGNAVPPLLARALAEHIMPVLQSEQAAVLRQERRHRRGSIS